MGTRYEAYVLLQEFHDAVVVTYPDEEIDDCTIFAVTGDMEYWVAWFDQVCEIVECNE